MAVIRKQNEIDVYTGDDSVITICELGGAVNEHTGNSEDCFVNVDVQHIDALVEALINAKNEILQRSK